MVPFMGFPLRLGVWGRVRATHRSAKHHTQFICTLGRLWQSVCQRTQAGALGAYTWALHPDLGLAVNLLPRRQARATPTAMKDCHVNHAEARRCGAGL